MGWTAPGNHKLEPILIGVVSRFMLLVLLLLLRAQHPPEHPSEHPSEQNIHILVLLEERASEHL